VGESSAVLPERRERQISFLWLLLAAVGALLFAGLIVPDPIGPGQHALRAALFWLAWYPVARRGLLDGDTRKEWRYWAAAAGATAAIAGLTAIWP
jgi:hypothetical protein